MRRMIDVNPFFVYILGFSIAMLVYLLDWSAMYPPLSTELILFLFFSFIGSLLLGIYFLKKRYFKYVKFKNKLNVSFLVILVTLGYIAEFIYARAIPIIAITNNTGFEYMEFGIPTFHVLLITFNGFLTIHLFNCYMSEGKTTYLWTCMYLFLFPLLIFSRGGFLMNLSSVFFVFLFATKRQKRKVYLGMLAFLLIILMLFGVLGNIRSKNQNIQNGEINANEFLLNLGEAKSSFEYSIIPKEYFWAYLYISSPLANLQENINHNKTHRVTPSHILEYVNSEINFDFISKRIFEKLNIERLWYEQIAVWLTVSTVYSRSYSYLGWYGIIGTYIYIMGFTLIYLVVLKNKSPYFVTGVAILNTMMLFSIFDNMFAFSGVSFQLVYPLIMSLKLKFK